MGKQWKWWQTISLDSKNTAAMEIKDTVPWTKSYNQTRQHIKKQRHYFTNISPSSESSNFLVAIYECDSWTIKKAEHRRIHAFELWCWRNLFRAPWTARRSNQSILKEIRPGYSLEGLMLKLKLQYFGHLMRRTALLEKTLILGKIEGGRRRGWQRMRWFDGITDLMDMIVSRPPGVGDGQVSLACCSPWGLKESDMTKQLNWTDLVMSICRVVSFVFGRECLLCPVCSLGKTLLAFALLHFVHQGQTCLLLQVSQSWL